MFSIKDSKDCKIRRDHRYNEARKAWIGATTYDWDKYHPGYQNLDVVKQYPKCILSNTTLRSLDHIYAKKHGQFNRPQIKFQDGKLKKKLQKIGKNKGNTLRFNNNSSNYNSWWNHNICRKEYIMSTDNYISSTEY
jgi:hypothetical protein